MKWYDKKFWEGRYVDIWTVPHTFLGVILAFGFLLLQWDLLWGIIITVLVAFFWEVFEIKTHIEEHITNRISDVFVALCGYGAVWVWYVTQSPDESAIITGMIAACTIFVVCNLVGWIAYKHYSVDYK